MVATNNEVGSTVVLANDGVPDSLTRTSHTHGEWQESENGHTVGVSWKESLVDTHTSEVVNVTWLGQTHDWVDQDIGLAGASGADCELSMSAMHWVASLESDNAGPAQLVEVKTELSWRVSKTDIVVMLETVDSLKLAANVVLFLGVVEVFDRWVLLIAAEDLLGFLRPIAIALDLLYVLHVVESTYLSGL